MRVAHCLYGLQIGPTRENSEPPEEYLLALVEQLVAPFDGSPEGPLPLGQVSRIDPAMVGFDAPSAEREAEAQACSIGAALLERTEELAGVLNRQASALVLDLVERLSE